MVKKMTNPTHPLGFVRTMKAAELADVNYKTFMKWVNAGLIHQHLVMGIQYYSVEEIRNVIESH